MPILGHKRHNLTNPSCNLSTQREDKTLGLKKEASDTMMEGDDEKGRDNKNRGNEGDEEPEEAAEYEVQRVKSQ